MKEKLPEIAQRGVLITNTRDQTKIQPVLNDYVEGAKDWEFNEQYKFLNRWARIFKQRLLDPIAVPGKPPLPDPVIGFERMRVETEAAYTLARNDHGLLYEINFNRVHYITGAEGIEWRFGQWGALETLLHEMIHLWQQNVGEHPYKKGNNTHNAEFVKKAEYFGLHPKPVVGCHIAPADGVFEVLMKEYGITRPEGEIPEDGITDWWELYPDKFKARPKGRSTLNKWECPECGLKLRVGVKSEIEVACMPCTRDKEDVIMFIRGK
jgi:hypothetical protein